MKEAILRVKNLCVDFHLDNRIILLLTESVFHWLKGKPWVWSENPDAAKV